MDESSFAAPLFVVAGPTAVGKGTVIRRLRERHPDLPLSISVTTREPRPGEVDGLDYRFVSEEEFDALVATGQLLEWALVHGQHRYGTPHDWVRDQRSKGNPVLLEVDLEGARQVKAHDPQARTVFIAPPSFDTLRERLLLRGSEGEVEMTRRLQTAEQELAAADEFDFVVINNDVDRAVRELEALLQLG